MHMKKIRSVVALLAIVGLPACGQDEAAPPVLEETGIAPTTMAEDSLARAPEANGPTDAQIAAIVVAANSADSTAGQLAETKATDPRVQEFGRRMVADHGAVNQQAMELANRLGLVPEASPTSRMLTEDAQQNMQQLQNLSGAAFDRAYIDHEVALHRQVLEALDQTLIPNASNPELKDLLEKGRPIFTGHLEMAEQIQSSLGSS